MKRLSWRYVSNIHVYNAFFLAYAEKVITIKTLFYLSRFFFIQGNLIALQKLFEKMRKLLQLPLLRWERGDTMTVAKGDGFRPQPRVRRKNGIPGGIRPTFFVLCDQETNT